VSGPQGASGAGTGPDISVLVPVFNELAGIAECHRQIRAALETSGRSWEIVYVNDGSTDGSDSMLRQIADSERAVTLVSLAYNVGQQSAMYAGLAFCRGASVVTLDSDLQCPPSCIVPLVEKLDEGYDMVGGIRVERSDELFGNRIPSMIGRFLINRALGVNQVDFGAVKAYSRRIVDLMVQANESIIVIPAMAYRFARRWTEIPIEHRARQTGVSKWTLYNRAELYADIFTLYARRPFAPLVALGCLFLALGIAIGMGAFVYRLFASEGFSGLIIFFAVFLFASGFYFVTTAMLGELLVRALRRQRQPVAAIAEAVSVAASPSKPDDA
jgi:undecaprenyl-phosphate 4-deoxy-4-formamido-L-arabinose transferase